MNLPEDDFILLSVVNTALRDRNCSLEEFAAEEQTEAEEIIRRLSAAGYIYDPLTNSFR